MPLRAASHQARTLIPYAERADPADGMLDQAWRGLSGRLAPVLGPWHQRRLRRMAALVEADNWQVHDDAALRQAAQALRPALLRHGFTPLLVAAAFALVREATRRHLGLWHYPVQLMGGWAILEGRLAEMATGEGKTITALLPAVTAALAGVPVHVVTVNGYLAARDAERMAPVYAALGLSVGLTVEGESPHERAAAYARDVTYCTNKDLVFDYLRDRLALRGRAGAVRHALVRVGDTRDGAEAPLLMRGLHFAIVDEADSVLIDEARTPLVISREMPMANNAAIAEKALKVARTLRTDDHFTQPGAAKGLVLTPAGKAMVEQLAVPLTGLWAAPRAREELVARALAAIHLYKRDMNYIVADGKVQIVDESTGRVMPDRSWERGLHQMVELKEAVPTTAPRVTLAQMTYQRFFRRYQRLGGMSGTATEARAELASVYRLQVLRIPRNRPDRRQDLGIHLLRDAPAKLALLGERVPALRAQGRPVLIGTRSVQASEEVSAYMTALGLQHVVLNARQDQDEAAVVAAAGQPGQVTVATNMAGRGTDIVISPEVAAKGGLHVILTEFHEAARVDRQLFGRTGRQGDAGSFEAIVSLQDPLFRLWLPAFQPVVRWLLATGSWLPAASLLRILAQWRAERSHSLARREAMRADLQLEKTLAFSGEG